MGNRTFVVFGALLAALLLAAPAHATFPGTNGKLAFDSDRSGSPQIYTMNPDGTGVSQVIITGGAGSGSPVADASNPAWSPDGQRIAYRCVDEFGQPDICHMKADGTDNQGVDGNLYDWFDPTWSPDGTRIALTWYREAEEGYEQVLAVKTLGGSLTVLGYPSCGWAQAPDWRPDGAKIMIDCGPFSTINPDGSGFTYLSGFQGWNPSWSPDGSKVAYQRYDTPSAKMEIWVANADGTSPQRLTTNAFEDYEPVWSPDGTKIAFASNEGGDYEIFVMNSDGTGRTALTSNTARDSAPNWRSIPINSYPRPKAATPLLFPLVPAYTACTAANRAHAAPLSAGSCDPPVQRSTQLTVGTPDANAQPAKSEGSLRLDAIGEIPVNVNNGNQADIRFRFHLDDVRQASDLTDYTGQLTARTTLRMTDRANSPHPGGPGAATVSDASYELPIACAATPDPEIGASCAVTTTANTLTPGSVQEFRRSIWQLGELQVVDGNGDLFQTQGVFVP